jgi:cation diffusion facilitator CzcD-associated flavoprotein CzcO
VTLAPSLNLEQARAIADQWLADFQGAIDAGDPAAAAALFLPDGYLRDLLALTWDLRTFSGREAITEALKDVLASRTISALAQSDQRPEVFERRRFGQTVEVFFTFDTDIAACRGHLRLLRSDDAARPWQAWTVATSLEELRGYPERVGARRPVAADQGHGGVPGSVLTAAEHAARYLTEEPEVVVIGAGQAGLTAAARLDALGVPTLVLEREPHVGDNWRNRYQSLVLHNQVWANHLPYLPFPASWPTYLAKDQLADWLEHYQDILGIAVWTSTSVQSGSYDSDAQRWNLTIAGTDGSGARELHPRHVVLATGVFGIPNRTVIPGSSQFSGAFLYAADYRGGSDVTGTRALVIGSGSSAHDVAQDLALNGAEVTLLQRSSTCVVSVDPGATRAYSIYREDGAPVDDCDLVTNAFPFPLLADLHRDMTTKIAELDADLLRGLEAAGFAIDFGDDGSGFLMKYHRTGGGYYINTGASELIVDGTIAVKQGVEVAGISGDTVRYTDSTTARFDLIVVATGYQNMSETVRQILGDEIANRVGPIWGLDSEGEPRVMWKRTAQPGLWVCGGSLQQCRPYSKYLAMQLKADQVGLTGA